MQLRVITTKGKAEMGRYALESSAQILQYYNDYFGVPYPLPKLDHIAIPGGFGGAMENWGGITYYESALLFDPENSSAATKQGIYRSDRARNGAQMVRRSRHDGVVGQSLAQRRIRFLDGNEVHRAFQSAVGSVAEKNVPRDPTRRVGIPKEAAMEGDARSTTHPIQQPIANEAEANSAFDDITYQKGSRSSDAGEFSGRRSFSRRHPQIHASPQIFEHDHGGSLECALRGVGQTGG